MKRRYFISALTASMGFAALSSCEKDFLEPTFLDNGELSGYRSALPPGSITRYPIKIPNVVAANNLDLSASAGISNIGGTNVTNVLAYNGTFPGPTIRVDNGSLATMQFHNGLNEPSIIHWHGMIVSTRNDGQPIHSVPPGESYYYRIRVNQRAALNWYHPHPHELTGKQVYHGLAGAFIINDMEEAMLNLPSGPYEVPLIIRDATFDNSGNLDYKPKSGGFLGNMPLVNGTLNPYLQVERGVYRFRILNGANARIFGLSLDNGGPMILIGNDGGLLASPSNLTRIDVSNGECLDVLIDFRQLVDGTNVMLRDVREGWDLLEFRVTGNTVVPFAGLPSVLSTIQPLPSPVRTRIFSFDGMSKINGLEYVMNRIDWTVPFGDTELWRFTTNGNAPHPVHVHGMPFQVVSRTGGRGQIFPWEQGWKDTVLLENQETVDVLVRFDRFKGIYLMHCHKLEHEDMGMMANFEVI